MKDTSSKKSPHDKSARGSHLEKSLKHLMQRNRKLSSLIDVGNIISSSLDLDRVIKLVMHKAQEVMNAQASCILLYDPKKRFLEFKVALGPQAHVTETLRKKITLSLGQGIAGWVAKNRKSLLIPDVSKDTRFFSEADRITGFKTRSIMAVPLIRGRKLIGVAEVLNPLDSRHFDAEDMEIFQTFCQQVAISIENARYHQEILRKRRIEQELKFAALIQRHFLLEEIPAFLADRCTIRAKNVPVREVGGDFYGLVERPPRHLGIFIGDVSGKGIASALFMATIVSEFRLATQQYPSPKELMAKLNEILCKRTQCGMFLTALYMVINCFEGTVTYCSAGHIPCLWKRSDKRQIELLWDGGPPLGISRKVHYTDGTFKLNHDDTLLLITDGVIEARNVKGEMFCLDRLISIMKKRPKTGFVNTVLRQIDKFSGSARQTDDITLLEFQWN